MEIVEEKKNKIIQLLSVDVGIKNLAFCLFKKEESSSYYTISKWDVINIGENETLVCQAIQKNEKCNKAARFTKNKLCFCEKHAKKQEYFIPNTDLKRANVHKKKIQELYDLADKYKIKYNMPIKKKELLDVIDSYIYNTCFEPISATNASKIDLITIGRNIKDKFDILFDKEGTIDYIIIENQISPIANRMKTIQGMIVQYFIMRNDKNIKQIIEFVSASCKLKDFAKEDAELIIEDQSKYSLRKKLGIQRCLEFLNDYKYIDWKDFFQENKKKDDLADSFLQGLWFINNKL
jgi:hypothetical protein